MTDKKKYIKEYLIKHDYKYTEIDDDGLEAVYNLYKYGKIPSLIPKDLYGFYAVYYIINGHIENGIKFCEFALKFNPSDNGAFTNLAGIYIDQKDTNNLVRLYMQNIKNGNDKYIDQLIEIYKDTHDMEKVQELFNMLTNDKQKIKYFANVCNINDFKMTNEMVNIIFNTELPEDAPLSLKLMKSIFCVPPKTQKID
jgi:hypothetical protein